MLIVFLFILALITGFYFSYSVIAFKRVEKLKLHLKKLSQNERDYKEAVEIFELHLNLNEYFNNSKYIEWLQKYEFLEYEIIPNFEKVFKGEKFENILTSFFKYRIYGREIINAHNNSFIDKESVVVQEFLKTKGNINSEQSRAIASGEDRTLLVAGAGTGKTTTIMGKIRYLVEKLKVNPGEILLLAFNASVVEELKGKLKEEYAAVSIFTFHALGLSVIGKAQGQKPEVAFSGDQLSVYTFLNEKFEALLSNVSYQLKVLNYFFYYLKPVEVIPPFENLDQYYQYIKSIRVVTFQKEIVKSQQEAFIANFLFRNQIKYIYEAPYKNKLGDSSHRQYKPDFYLPDYDIYIEHFGIDREGMVHFSKNQELNARYSKQYWQEMQLKRFTHKKFKTTLVETYSYEFSERNWEEKLTKKLTEKGVKIIPRNSGEILDLLKEGQYIAQFIELCDTFLNLAKSGGFTKQSLQSAVAARGFEHEKVFLELFLPLFDAYEGYLKETGKVDFHDMLTGASEFITKGQYRSQFKYVLIDEFQDFSVSKYNLVKALCDQSPELQLFCVGDDWQSIYRFSGSDVSLMSEFEKYFGFTRRSLLEETHRFNGKIAEISNEFILKNPLQIKKRVRSTFEATEKVLEVLYKPNFRDQTQLFYILENLNNNAQQKGFPSKVYLLGRYNDEKPKNLLEIQKTYTNLDVKFLTMHRSKGLEAEYVIILNAIAGEHGFPSEIVDDPLLNIVLKKDESYPFAEERRLMYVAMTRARHKVFILTMKGRESVFVKELLGSTEPIKEKETNVICKNCGGNMVAKTGPYRTFLGCRNYPDCDYTVKLKSNRN